MLNKERSSKPWDHVQRRSTSGPNQHHIVRTFFAENPEVEYKVKGLKGMDVYLEYWRRAPYPERKAARKTTLEHDAPNARLEQIVYSRGKVGEGEAVAAIQKGVRASFKFVSPNAIEPEQHAALEELNNHPAVVGRQREVALRRLRSDRTIEEQRRFMALGAIGLGTGAIVSGMEGKGNEWLFAGGLFAAQTVDDTSNIVLAATAEKGGTKSLRDIILENKKLLPMLLASAAADRTIIPFFLQSHETPEKLIGGLLFFVASSGVSLGAAGLNMLRSAKSIKKQDIEKILTKGDIAKKAFNENKTSQFLLYGGGVSLIAALGAAESEKLIGQDYSGFLQTGIGQMETAVTYGSLLAANAVSDIKEYVRNLWKLRNLKKSSQKG